MHLPPSTQDSVATEIADYVRLNAAGYGAVAARVGHTGYPEAAVVAIAKNGKTDCTAKVAVHHNRLVYVSAAGAHISYPTHWSDSGRIVCGLLSMEHD